MFKHALIAATALGGLMVAAPMASSQAMFESTGLGDIDPWGVGTLSQADGAFPLTLWQGSEAEDLLPVLMRIDARSLTPVSRDILRRVLLSSSRAPEGEGADQLLAQRIRLIWALGELDAYAELARQLPQIDGIPTSLEAQTELSLIRGNLASACSSVRSASQSTPYMFAARATCFALEGNFSSANLALELGAEMGNIDPWVVTAIGALQTLPAEPTPRDLRRLPSANFTSGLSTALSLAGSFPVSDATLEAMNPGIALELAQRSDTSRALRINSADIAAYAGLMSVDARRRAYRTDPVPTVPPNEDGTPGEVDETINAPVNLMDEALQMANDRGSEEADRVDIYRRVLTLSGADTEKYTADAGLLVQHLSRLRDLDALSNNGEFFALAAFAAGDARQSSRFQRVVEIEGGPQPDLFLQSWLDAMRILTGMDTSAESARLVSTRLAQVGEDTRAAQVSEMLYTMLLQEHPISPVARDFLTGDAGSTLSEGNAVDIQSRILLRSAFTSGATGEALIQLISILGARPDMITPEDLGDVLQLLEAEGFTDVAEALAIEALNYQQVRD
ncbi:hypothetical protein [Ponticaulis sp.]|uniref:hypothetical protein n=1 Tax=Ponticaulis sp. TaxID=2020902 RepID=UPI000B6795CA|nr:hypothetical protein [Ponticaulis sp.]MAI90959.1 hypothetical protein [Ponticaulis sp.]OUX98300.1 MAG: hypothetical protein CBB65_10980 [Hyphomonadaceae bacterium TMED5]|tara:strand:+ start:2525 stop:4216 length:1692 start_codon:yes stop_codon:yes gene_type:complete